MIMRYEPAKIRILVLFQVTIISFITMDALRESSTFYLFAFVDCPGLPSPVLHCPDSK